MSIYVIRARATAIERALVKATQRVYNVTIIFIYFSLILRIAYKIQLFFDISAVYDVTCLTNFESGRALMASAQSKRVKRAPLEKF